MSTLIIGDFRTKQLQQYQLKGFDDKFSYTYLVEDTAEFTWFSTTAKYQLALNNVNVKNVIIALGFNDCVYSCVWEQFDIKSIINDYVKTINELASLFSSTSFYVCSIAPIESSYPFAEYSGGSIPKTELLDKIVYFNSIIKEACKNNNIIFIDCYNYLTFTSFGTYDGVRFMADTSKDILEYINNCVINKNENSFIPRFSAPDMDTEDEDGVLEGDAFWKAEIADGLNPFPLSEKYGKSDDDTLPNCTAYAWGRFYEILDAEPKLSVSDDGGQWYLYEEDGYLRGDTPAEGAIICWEGIDSNLGFVAVVEQLNSDGSIITSESMKNDSRYWWTSTRTNEDGNWSADSSKYNFQGFIYNPAVVYFGNNIDKSKTTSNNSSLGTSLINESFSNIDGISQEMINNAKYIWNYLVHDNKWTPNAAAALIGNVQRESTINPGRFEYYTKDKSSPLYLGPNPTQTEIDTYLKLYKEKKGRYPGYGLTQWTSKNINSWGEHKFVKWCNERSLDITDIDSALQRIIWEADNGEQWYGYPQDKKDYPITFKEFTKSTREPEWLAAAFLLRYEIPGNRYAAIPGRGRNARYWYDLLISSAPEAAAPLNVYSFKIDSKTATSITASFLAQSCKSGVYSITNAMKSEEDSGSIEIYADKILIITSNKLKPNTKYTLTIKLVGDTEFDIIEKSIDFDTPQEPPDSVRSIRLEANDTKLPNDSFKLVTDTSSINWGYWKKTGKYGYTLQLVVNGKIVEEINKDYLDKTWKFELSEEFNSYESKVGDIIQICVCPWVEDDNGDTIKCLVNKASNSICMLTKPVTTYLNID